MLKKIKYDSTAREEFCFNYYSLIKYHVYFKYGHYSDWEDIVHEVVQKLIETDWSDQALIDSPSAWLFRIADNKAIDFIRKNHRIVELDEDAIAADFSLDKAIMRDEVRDAISKLPPDLQYITYEFYWEGEELYSIAEKLNLSYSNARVKLSRARKFLAKILKK